MRRTLFVCLLCLLLIGCGKEEEPKTVVSQITYKVDTGDTVEIVMSSKTGYSIELLGDDSIIIKSESNIADVRFTDTIDVLDYTSTMVPRVMANYPAYWLDTKQGKTCALLLGENTTMLVRSLADTDSVSEALDCCEIYIYRRVSK